VAVRGDRRRRRSSSPQWFGGRGVDEGIRPKASIICKEPPVVGMETDWIRIGYYKYSFVTISEVAINIRPQLYMSKWVGPNG
jgi:hypothetical protein